MIPISICVGCGLDVNEFGVLIVDRNPATGVESGLACSDADGLSLAVQKGTGSCVDLAGLGTTVSPLVANLNLDTTQANGLACGSEGIRVDVSPDSCNGLTFHGNELFSACPDSLVGTGNFGFEGGTVPVAINGLNNTYNFISDCESQAGATCVAGGGGTQIQFTNPTCCTVEGFWEFIAYGGVINGASADFDATAFLTTSINNGAYSETPFNNMKYYGDADKTVFELGGFHAKNYIILAPGTSFQVSAQMTVFVATGSATWALGPNFEVYAHLTQTGCACI